jgi:hypothetical protein
MCAAECRMQDGQSAIVPGAANNKAFAVPRAVARGTASHRGGTVINRPRRARALTPDRLSRNRKGSSRSLSRRNTARIAPT